MQYFKKRIATTDDPRRFGKPLAYDKYGLWRYRVGNARIVCSIEDNQLLVLVVQVGIDQQCIISDIAKLLFYCVAYAYLSLM